MIDISVVIPVFRSEYYLKELYDRLLRALGSLKKDFEIIFVEDAGGDSSWDIIVELARKDKRIRGIKFSRNFGQHYAITAGLDASRGEWVVVMDSDLQDRPEEIPRLLAKAREGFDIVLACRKKRRDSFIKRAASYLFYKSFNLLTGMNYNAQVGNFRIISRRVARNFTAMRENLRFFGGLIDWLGFKAAFLEVEHDLRKGTKSSYTFKKLRKLAIETIIAYSDRPLKLSIKFGFIMSFFAFVYGSFLLLRALIYGSPVMGWSSLIVSLYFVGGIVIFNLGIIGIYLGKTFDETKKRPLYIISETTFNEDSI